MNVLSLLLTEADLMEADSSADRGWSSWEQEREMGEAGRGSWSTSIATACGNTTS